MKHFWTGFEKQANAVIRKGLQSGKRAFGMGGKAPGLTPSSGITTATAFKPNPVPTAKPMASATQNLAPKINGSPIAPPPKSVGRGVPSMHI